MSSYAKIARQRKRARSLYLELRALNLDGSAVEDLEDLTDYRVMLEVLCSLSEAHKDWMVRRVRASKLRLLKILLNRWDLDLGATWREGEV